MLTMVGHTMGTSSAILYAFHIMPGRIAPVSCSSARRHVPASLVRCGTFWPAGQCYHYHNAVKQLPLPHNATATTQWRPVVPPGAPTRARPAAAPTQARYGPRIKTVHIHVHTRRLAKD